MINHLKNFDLFGSKFTFTIDNSSKYRTQLGSVLSITCLMLTLIFIFFFGTDFFNRTNPRVLMKSVIPKEYFKVNFTKTNFLFPWRVNDVNSQPVNFTGVIYPVFTYLQYQLNNQSQMIKTRTIIMNITKCDTSFQSLINGVNLSNYYCPDWSDFPYEMGGNTDGTFVDKLQIQIHYCPDGKSYSPNNNCTSLEKLDKAFNPALNNWYISYFYPQYLFTPDNLDNPFTIFYQNYNFALNIGLTKTDRFYFQKPVLYDDQGWIMVSNKTSETLSILKQTSDFSTFPRDQYYTAGQSSMFYRLVIYVDKTHDEIQRTFMKFQELTALVGGFMKIITSFCWFISQIYNSYHKEQFLLNKVFDFSKRNEKNPDLIQKLGKSNMLNSNLDKESQTLSINFLRKDPKKGESVLPQKIKDSIEIQINKYFKENEMSKKYQFGMVFSYRFLFCPKKLTLSNKTGIYKTVTEYMCNKLDVTFYLENLIVLDRIRAIIFNSQQNQSMSFMRKINVNENEDKKLIMSCSKEKKKVLLREIIEYFIDLFQNNRISQNDQNIFDSLDTDIKKIIMESI